MWEAQAKSDRKMERGYKHGTLSVWASCGAATHQFLSEPGYSFIDTPEAFQFACGQRSIAPAGTPGRWEQLSGFPQRDQRHSISTGSLFQACLLWGS